MTDIIDSKKLGSFREYVAAIIAERKINPLPFEPYPFFNKYADYIEIYFEDINSYSETINDYLTVYKSVDDKQKITGCRIYGVREAIESWDMKMVEKDINPQNKKEE